tara:strand:- start:281 stop:973 length:693 start_codon:yes stop_codon:yes gene_type:complete
MNNQKFVALLPLKLNSERVPNKNFKTFAGKPLFSWILEALNETKEISSVIINTDASEELMRKGFVPTDKNILRERPQELSGDDVSMNLIINDDLNSIEADYFIMTHTTNPLLTSRTISKAITTFLSSKNSDSLFTANEVHSRFYDSEAKPINHDPLNLVRTQDLPAWYEENSCLYIFSKDSFSINKTRIGSSPLIHPIPKNESIDIDDKYDWEIAESVMKNRVQLNEINN